MISAIQLLNTVSSYTNAIKIIFQKHYVQIGIILAATKSETLF